MNRMIIPAAAIAAAFPCFPAAAQKAVQPAASSNPAVADSDSTADGSDTATAVPPTAGNAKAAHPDTDEEIVVTGVKRAAGDVLGGAPVLHNQQLPHTPKPGLPHTPPA